MRLNLLVLRTENPELLKGLYELIGLTFEKHQHGKGPLHYSSVHNDVVFEIYPLDKSMTNSTDSVRLGFEVDDLQTLMNALENSNWKIISGLTETEWGTVAIIQDTDGRKVELKKGSSLL